MLYTYGSKAKVRKVHWNSEAPPRCWWVFNHPTGSQGFAIWEDAMKYARSRPVMMNNAA